MCARVCPSPRARRGLRSRACTRARTGGTPSSARRPRAGARWRGSREGTRRARGGTCAGVRRARRGGARRCSRSGTRPPPAGRSARAPPSPWARAARGSRVACCSTRTAPFAWWSSAAGAQGTTRLDAGRTTWRQACRTSSTQAASATRQTASSRRARTGTSRARSGRGTARMARAWAARACLCGSRWARGAGAARTLCAPRNSRRWCLQSRRRRSTSTRRRPTCSH
mmetsp:Transcript_6941/g.17740  ORF Transcript_6941/g.17740 Transcript_6941/m.17740 type:complete len:227 (-) Transcript_6941:1491-2171(-)